MTTTRIKAIPASRITDWSTFHDVFANALGFPDHYGRNLNAWVDCLIYADDPVAQMIAAPVSKGDVLTLRIDDAVAFSARCPEQFEALLDNAAFVNFRRIEMGAEPVLALLLVGGA